MPCPELKDCPEIPSLTLSQDGRPAAPDNKKDLKVQRIATCSVFMRYTNVKIGLFAKLMTRL